MVVVTQIMYPNQSLLNQYKVQKIMMRVNKCDWLRQRDIELQCFDPINILKALSTHTASDCRLSQHYNRSPALLKTCSESYAMVCIYVGVITKY